MASGNVETLIDAVKEKQELFDRHYQRLFPHNVDAERVYLYWLLGTQTDEERQKQLFGLQFRSRNQRTVGCKWYILGCLLLG